MQNLNFGLAPMDGVTDLPMRIWLAMTSAPDFCVSPFLRVTQTFPNSLDACRDVWPELFEAKEMFNYKFIPQLMASDPSRFAATTRMLSSVCDQVELNCGCPAPTVVGHNAGSSILRDPFFFRSFIDCICGEVGAVFRLKMRLGFDDAAEFSNLINVLKDFDLSCVTIHGRTRVQQYKGLSDWSAISHARAELTQSEVVGSGDILCRRTLEDRLQIDFGARSVLVGRGAWRNPWIFSELRTGKPTFIRRGVLLEALKVYLLLTWAIPHANTKLWDAFEKMPVRCFGGAIDEWGAFRQHLESGLCIRTEETDAGRISILGRLKFVWSGLRTSLPLEAMDPLLFRERSVEGLLRNISESLPESFVVTHRPEHDWIFSGRRTSDANTL